MDFIRAPTLGNFPSHMNDPLKPETDLIPITHNLDHLIIDCLLLVFPFFLLAYFSIAFDLEGSLPYPFQFH